MVALCYKAKYCFKSPGCPVNVYPHDCVSYFPFLDGLYLCLTIRNIYNPLLRCFPTDPGAIMYLYLPHFLPFFILLGRPCQAVEPMDSLSKLTGFFAQLPDRFSKFTQKGRAHFKGELLCDGPIYVIPIDNEPAQVGRLVGCIANDGSFSRKIDLKSCGSFAMGMDYQDRILNSPTLHSLESCWLTTLNTELKIINYRASPLSWLYCNLNRQKEDLFDCKLLKSPMKSELVRFFIPSLFFGF